MVITCPGHIAVEGSRWVSASNFSPSQAPSPFLLYLKSVQAGIWSNYSHPIFLPALMIREEGLILTGPHQSLTGPVSSVHPRRCQKCVPLSGAASREDWHP